MSLRIKYNNVTSNKVYLTLNDKYIGTITTNLLFYIQFTRSQDSITHEVAAYDYSPYPDTYNELYFSSVTGDTSLNNAPLEQGWYKYEVYTYEDRLLKTNLLETGQAYVYDNDITPGNIPDNTETYVETKDKYVYNRD